MGLGRIGDGLPLGSMIQPSGICSPAWATTLMVP